MKRALYKEGNRYTEEIIGFEYWTELFEFNVGVEAHPAFYRRFSYILPVYRKSLNPKDLSVNYTLWPFHWFRQMWYNGISIHRL